MTDDVVSAPPPAPLTAALEDVAAHGPHAEITVAPDRVQGEAAMPLGKGWSVAAAAAWAKRTGWAVAGRLRWAPRDQKG